MNLTDFQKRLLWGLGILSIFIVWITFPLIFKTWVFTLLVKPPFTPEAFATLGPIGDIFGGLTAFFTSATLIIVMYSAYLQRKANKDAREAMAEQLKQARESTIQQLDLAKATHDAQLQESRYSIFINGFNSLLNYKHDRYMSIQTTKGSRTYQAHEVFTHLNIGLRDYTENEWKDISKVTPEQVEQDFYSVMNEISNIGNHTELMGYFTTVSDLYNFINHSSINADDKEFYKSMVLNSLTTGEQAALYWIGAFRSEFNTLARNEKCFDFAYHENMMPFSIKFYSKECFGITTQNNWELHLPN